MENKTILITGTTNGLGKQLSYLLAKDNQLILLGRNESLLKALKEELIKESNNPSIDYAVCDYSNIDSVYQTVDTIKKKYEVIDVIIHNAGALLKPNGNKVHPALMVNYISPLLLNELLLDLLLKSNSPILFYTSTMAIPKSISFDILDNMKDDSRIKSYGLSKLAFNLYLTSINNKTISIKVFDPKIVYTNAVKTMIPKYIRWISPLVLLFSRTPKNVAKNALKVLDKNNVNHIDYYVLTKLKPNKKLLRHISKTDDVIRYAKKELNITNNTYKKWENEYGKDNQK
ncbi:MAG: SDR family NAD(P)-dependent oxidoreductase [Candidatus Izemoplasmatales bacterium]|nr:SDR family NAD(P)-dependent oxidoreductase [Candidatus Izemoplasmatales bacterium]